MGKDIQKSLFAVIFAVMFAVILSVLDLCATQCGSLSYNPFLLLTYTY